MSDMPPKELEGASRDTPSVSYITCPTEADEDRVQGAMFSLPLVHSGDNDDHKSDVGQDSVDENDGDRAPRSRCKCDNPSVQGVHRCTHCKANSFARTVVDVSMCFYSFLLAHSGPLPNAHSIIHHSLLQQTDQII